MANAAGAGVCACLRCCHVGEIWQKSCLLGKKRPRTPSGQLELVPAVPQNRFLHISTHDHSSSYCMSHIETSATNAPAPSNFRPAGQEPFARGSCSGAPPPYHEAGLQRTGRGRRRSGQRLDPGSLRVSQRVLPRAIVLVRLHSEKDVHLFLFLFLLCGIKTV